MKIIVGLGNPGKQYENTRHNLGFMALDALAEKSGLSWRESKKLNALVVKGADFILLKPQTFMNDSGRSVAAALNFYKLAPEDLTVIHDDLDIELGKLKIAVDSRSAGHNGVQSIIDQLGTKNFERLRIGIKPKPDLARSPRFSYGGAGRSEMAAKFVLEKFSAAERKIIDGLLPKVLKELK